MITWPDGEPVGVVQRSKPADYPEYLTEFETIVPVPPGTVTLDYFIGAPERVGQGLGPRLIAAMVERTWPDHPDTQAILVAANRASWRALEKAGAVHVGTGDMEPDNPIDAPTHHIHRFDRPTT